MQEHRQSKVRFEISASSKELFDDFKELFRDSKDFPESKYDDSKRYYEWPFNPDMLTMLLRIQPHHESAIECKTDTAAIGYRPHYNNRHYEAWAAWEMFNQAIRGIKTKIRVEPEKTVELMKDLEEVRKAMKADRSKFKGVSEFFGFLPPKAVRAAIFDYCYLGNGFLRFTGPMKERELVHLHGRTIRIGKKKYFRVADDETKETFGDKEVIHIGHYGPESSVYGIPGYLGSKGSNVLADAYEKLYLRFLKNGAHLGHVFLLNIAFDDFDKEKGESPTEEKIKEAVVKAKNVGNGQNFYLNLGGIVDEQGKQVPIEEMIKIIPLGELLAKLNLDKKTSEALRDNILSAHRVPPEVLSVVVEKKSAGDLNKTIGLYSANTVRPIQHAFRDGVNARVDSSRWIDFDPYDVETA